MFNWFVWLNFYVQVYVGYVDDPRNTDNAWIETTALNFHDENGETLRSVELKVQPLTTAALYRNSFSEYASCIII